MSYIRHHDDEGIDIIQIKVVPRYKTSGLSGDEWRVSAKIVFGYKGHIIYEKSFGRVEWAVAALPYLLMTYREEMGSPTTKPAVHPCDQPGCQEPATITYRMKATYDNLGHKSEAKMLDNRQYLRAFCERHSTRGDCGLEDSDDNYEVIGSKDSLKPPRLDDESPSAFGGVIDLSDSGKK